MLDRQLRLGHQRVVPNVGRVDLEFTLTKGGEEVSYGDHQVCVINQGGLSIFKAYFQVNLAMDEGDIVLTSDYLLQYHDQAFGGFYQYFDGEYSLTILPLKMFGGTIQVLSVPFTQPNSIWTFEGII